MVRMTYWALRAHVVRAAGGRLDGATFGFRQDRARAGATVLIVVAGVVAVASPSATAAGNVSGTVHGASGALPEGTVSVVACPAESGSWSSGCFDGVRSPVPADGAYTLPLGDGTWAVGAATVQGLALGVTQSVSVNGADLPATNFTVSAAVVTARVQ